MGSAIQKCGVPRDELFLTTKVWISNAGYEKAKASIDRSLQKLHTDYIDLLLIHQPFSDYYGTYRAMEEAYRAGKLRGWQAARHRRQQLLSRPPDRPVPVRRNHPGGQPGGDPRLPSAAGRAPVHEKVRRTARVLGPLRRGTQRLFHQSRSERNRPEVQQVRRADCPALSAAERRGGHPQIHPQGADGAKP